MSLTDPTSNVTQWGYDDAGRTTSETDPLGKVTGYAYDDANRLVTVTDRTGRTRTLGYDAADRLTGDTWKAAGGSTLQTNSYTYDANGNQLSAGNANASYAVGYDNLNRVVSVAGPFGVTQAFTYDAADNRLTASDNQGGVTTSTFDNLDRLTSRTLAVGGTNAIKAAWSYTAAGDVDTASRSAWVSGAWSAAGSTAYTTDPLGRGTDLVHKNAGGTTVGGASYTFDAGDRVTGQTINGATQTFGYDSLDQITNNDGATLTYDASGNRTVSGYMIGAGNRVTSDGTWTYTHDDTGAVTGKSKSGEAWAYTYDLNGQMTSASKSATVGGTVTDAVAYTYDAWGNRVSRTQSGTTSSTERYVVDGWDTAKDGAAGTENFDVTIDLNSSNAVTGRRLIGAGFDAAVARRDAGGAVSWSGADGLGSVRQVFDNSGAVTGSRAFDGFGNVTASSGTGLDRYGYTGTVTDPLTGLVGDNARSYDPTAGRWLSEDPKGFGAGDVNLHRYVGNNATGATDPSGKENPFLQGFVRGLLGPGADVVLPSVPAAQQALSGSMIGGIAAGVALEATDWTDRTFVNPPPPPTDTERITALREMEQYYQKDADEYGRWQADLGALANGGSLGRQVFVGLVDSVLSIPKTQQLFKANVYDVAATSIEEQNGINTGPSASDRRYACDSAIVTEFPLVQMWRNNVPATISPTTAYLDRWASEAEAVAPKNYKRGVEAAPGVQEVLFALFDVFSFLPFTKLFRVVGPAERLAPRALRVGGEVGLERMNIAVRVLGEEGAGHLGCAGGRIKPSLIVVKPWEEFELQRFAMAGRPLTEKQIEQFGTHMRVYQNGRLYIDDGGVNVPARFRLRGRDMGATWVLPDGEVVVILRSNGSSYFALHEYLHVAHFKQLEARLGRDAAFEAWHALTVREQEQAVFDVVRGRFWDKLTKLEQHSAIRYIQEVGGFAW